MVPHALLEFELFGQKLSIQLYGIFIALGIVLCLVVLYLYTSKRGMPTKLQDFIFFIGIFAIAMGFLFAKIFQAFYNWIESGKFNFASAGITVMGGIIGGAAAFLLVYFLAGHFYFKGKDKNLHIKQFNSLLGVAPCCITIAHAFGRVGCLMAGCCHGTFLGTEYVVGGVWMDGVKNGWGYYIPAQLYEALFLFALFAVLSVLYFKRVNINIPIYLVGYAIWRFIIEFFRGDDRGGSGGALSPSQWQSFIFIGIAILVVAFYLWRKIPLFGKLKCEEESEQYKNKKAVAGVCLETAETVQNTKEDNDKPVKKSKIVKCSGCGATYKKKNDDDDACPFCGKLNE